MATRLPVTAGLRTLVRKLTAQYGSNFKAGRHLAAHAIDLARAFPNTAGRHALAVLGEADAPRAPGKAWAATIEAVESRQRDHARNISKRLGRILIPKDTAKNEIDDAFGHLLVSFGVRVKPRVAPRRFWLSAVFGIAAEQEYQSYRRAGRARLESLRLSRQHTVLATLERAKSPVAMRPAEAKAMLRSEELLRAFTVRMMAGGQERWRVELAKLDSLAGLSDEGELAHLATRTVDGEVALVRFLRLSLAAQEVALAGPNARQLSVERARLRLES